MQQVELNRPKKRFLGRLGIGMFAAAALLTFLSKTIDNLLAPKVTAVRFTKGSLTESFEVEGTLEFLNKSRIASGGNWKVEEVAVKAGQYVKKGDVLAVMNEKDVQIDLKTLEYEIIRLENDLQSYRENFRPVRLSDYEREVQLAEKEAEAAKKQLEIIKEMFEAGLESGKNLEDAQNNYDSKLYQYQAKKELLEDKKKEYQYAQEQFERTVREKSADLELKKMIYERKYQNVTGDGKIVSDIEGYVTAVNVYPGMVTSSNQVMFEIMEISSPYRVTWYLNPGEAAGFEVGDEVYIRIAGEIIEEGETVIKTESLKTAIAGKEFIADRNMYKYWADISKTEDETAIEVKDGQKAEIIAFKNSETYDFLLPKCAVTEKQGKYYIFELRKRPGALGEEDYVVETEVNVIDEDDFYVALEGLFDEETMVVENTTKPLSDWMKVVVR